MGIAYMFFRAYFVGALVYCFVCVSWAPLFSDVPSSRNVEAEILVESRLAERVGASKAKRLVERYGTVAEDSLVLEVGLRRVMDGSLSPLERERVDEAIERVVERGLGGGALRKRRQLAQSWFLVYEITRRLRGNTREALEQLRVVCELNPDDTVLARALQREEKRAAIVQARLEAARAVRADEQPESAIPANALEGSAL